MGMCYIHCLKCEELKFLISNRFGVGFDWKNEQFKKAVNNRDERIWKILEWAVNGKAEIYNKAAEFECYFCGSSASFSTQFEYCRQMHIQYEKEKLENNPNLSAETKKIFKTYYDGSLEKVALKEEEQRLRDKKAKRLEGYIYLIRAENGLYKIGKAKNITARMKPFHVNFPMNWKLIYSFKSNDYSYAEELLHAKYEDRRDVGEWFKLLPADVKYITSIQDGQI